MQTPQIDRREPEPKLLIPVRNGAEGLSIIFTVQKFIEAPKAHQVKTNGAGERAQLPFGELAALIAVSLKLFQETIDEILDLINTQIRWIYAFWKLGMGHNQLRIRKKTRHIAERQEVYATDYLLQF